MWPSWVTVAIFQTFAVAGLAVPLIFIEGTYEQVAFAVACGVFIVVVTVVTYSLAIASHFTSFADALSVLQSPASELHPVLSGTDPATTNTTQWTSEDPFGAIVLRSLDNGAHATALLDSKGFAASSRHNDVFELQGRLRDAVRTLAAQQRALFAIGHGDRATMSRMQYGSVNQNRQPYTPYTEDDEDMKSCRSHVHAYTVGHRRVESYVVPDPNSFYDAADADQSSSLAVLAPKTLNFESPPFPPRLRQQHCPTVARGSRFRNDNDLIAIYIQRNKNDNVIVYAARTVPFGTSAILIASNPIDAYWLKIDGQSMANARLRGKTDDRVELNLIERRLAYGITCSAAEDGGDVRRRCFKVKFVALPRLELELSMIDAADAHGDVRRVAVMTATIDGHPSIAERIWVQASETSWTPRVEYVELFGQRLDDGAMVRERFVP
jgi:hypothetical protein